MAILITRGQGIAARAVPKGWIPARQTAYYPHSEAAKESHPSRLPFWRSAKSRIKEKEIDMANIRLIVFSALALMALAGFHLTRCGKGYSTCARPGGDRAVDVELHSRTRLRQCGSVRRPVCAGWTVRQGRHRRQRTRGAEENGLGCQAKIGCRKQERQESAATCITS